MRHAGVFLHLGFPIAIPTHFIQFAFLPKHQRKGLDIPQIDAAEGGDRAIGGKNIPKDLSAALPVSRLRAMLFERAVEKHQRRCVVAQGAPCPAG